MKRFILILFLLMSVFCYAQKDTVIDRGIFKVKYSQKLKQPKWVKYAFRMHECSATREGMDFYEEPDVVTSSDVDYANNDYDKGHLAPAASSCWDYETLYRPSLI